MIIYLLSRLLGSRCRVGYVKAITNVVNIFFLLLRFFSKYTESGINMQQLFIRDGYGEQLLGTVMAIKYKDHHCIWCLMVLVSINEGANPLTVGFNPFIR